jgi:hypothetical protein
MQERLKTARVKTIRQGQLSSECWTVQMWGTAACDTCEYRDTDECGGKAIRQTGENEHGHAIGKDGLPDAREGE